jgi:hypothetical protein
MVYFDPYKLVPYLEILDRIHIHVTVCDFWPTGYGPHFTVNALKLQVVYSKFRYSEQLGHFK